MDDSADTFVYDPPATEASTDSSDGWQEESYVTGASPSAGRRSRPLPCATGC